MRLVYWKQIPGINKPIWNGCFVQGDLFPGDRKFEWIMCTVGSHGLEDSGCIYNLDDEDICLLILMNTESSSDDHLKDLREFGIPDETISQVLHREWTKMRELMKKQEELLDC